MNFIDEFFQRQNLQNLRSFLLGGSECFVDQKSFSQRIKTSEHELSSFLRKKFPDPKERDEIAEAIAFHTGNISDIYMEMGMKSGARIVADLLVKDDNID